MHHLSRRRLLQWGSALSLTWLGLDRRLAGAEPWNVPRLPALVPDPQRLLDLPPGFRYVIVSKSGARMADGLITPGAMDGMAAFAGPAGSILLVRNHELTPGNVADGPFGADLAGFAALAPASVYDRGGNRQPSQGGTTTVVLDGATGTLRHEFLSLAGTNRNCAGGPTPWGSWISCEEDLTTVGTNDRGWQADRRHGYAFEVPARAEPGLAEPIPLRAMGRFNREAVAIDPASGIVYQTEDARDGVFTRFVPHKPGELRAGGKLQALRILEYPNPVTSNWGAAPFPVGATHACSWVDIANPDDNPAAQARAQGAQAFTRGEGCWFGSDAVWFACTDGGPARKGQIWRYVPGLTSDDGGSLTLFVEPNDGAVLENVDNITVTPWGALFACEDNSSKGASPENRMLHVRPDGLAEVFAVNRLNSGELAGACFSPDGKWCFVNIMYPGLTLAITGPWATLAPTPS